MKKIGNLVRWILVVVLLALLAGNTYFAMLAHKEHQAQRVLAEQMQPLFEQQRRTILNTFADYQADAYGPDIDRIAEQQLIAAEYQVMLSQTIAMQNVQILELLCGVGYD